MTTYRLLDGRPTTPSSGLAARMRALTDAIDDIRDHHTNSLTPDERAALDAAQRVADNPRRTW